MPKIIVYGSPGEDHTGHITSLCSRRFLDYEFRDVTDPENMKWLYEQGFDFIPQVFVEDETGFSHLGGFSGLLDYIGKMK